MDGAECECFLLLRIQAEPVERTRPALLPWLCAVKFRRAIVQIIHIAVETVAGHFAIAAGRAAGVAHCFCPVIAGIISILTRRTIQNNAFTLAAEQSAVRVHDIAGERALSVFGVLWYTP